MSTWSYRRLSGFNQITADTSCTLVLTLANAVASNFRFLFSFKWIRDVILCLKSNSFRQCITVTSHVALPFTSMLKSNGKAMIRFFRFFQILSTLLQPSMAITFKHCISCKHWKKQVLMPQVLYRNWAIFALLHLRCLIAILFN